MERIETGQINSRVTWLEDEQRKDSIQITKLQQQVEQMWNIYRDLGLRQEAVEQFANVARGQLSRLQGIEETTRQLRERLLALQEDLSNHGQANERNERIWQGEIERIKQSLSEHWHRMDLMQRQIDEAIARIPPLADSQRRQAETVGQLGQMLEELRDQADRLVTRQELADQQIKRNEQEIGRVERELEPLRRQDEVAVTKTQIVADQIRRVDEQVHTMAGREQVIQELAEKLQVYRLELQRGEQEIGETQLALTEQAQRQEEHARQLKLLEERRVAQLEQIDRLFQSIRDTRSELLDLSLDWQHLLEQQKVRDLAEVERQVKEMKERILRHRTAIPTS
ncbi:MAG: hypothetical protein HY331_12620 [Chloroflexi bacterium]|nr:hypothetical protein [Chloroflexota bacterium]